MKRTIVSNAVALSFAIMACGGSDKPAQSPNDPAPDAPASSGPASTAGKAGGASGAAAPAGDDYGRGMAAFKAGDWNGARTSFEAAIKKNPKQADAHYALGLVMDKTGDRASAEKHYKDALAIDPAMIEPAENLTAIYVEDKRYDDAIGVAKKALEKHDKNAELLLNYAIALGMKGDEKDASKAFEDALKLSPNDARFFLAYAQQLAAWKKRDDAVAKLKAAQHVAGEDAAMLGSIGFELRTLRAVPECIAAFDKAIGVKDNADFRTNRALCKLAAKDGAGAKSDLEAAIKIEPQFPIAHYWLGATLHDEGKFPEAAAEYSKYLEIAPNGPAAKAAQAKLKLAKAKKKK